MMEYIVMGLISFCTTYNSPDQTKISECRKELIKCVVAADKGLIHEGHKRCVRDYVERNER